MHIMVFCPENAKRDQNLKFTALSETTGIAAPFIWESSHTPPPPPPPGDGLLEFEFPMNVKIIVLEVIIGAY